MVAVRACVLLFAIAGCANGSASSSVSPPSTASEAAPVASSGVPASGFEGTIRVPEEAPAGKGKLFKGAWIEREGGERWVIDYAPDSPFRALSDRRVRVEGDFYEPKDQALVAKHFRVRSLVVVGKDAADARLVHIGEKKRLRGRFSELTAPPGSKLAGDKTRVFVDAGGRTYHLEHVPDGGPDLGAPVAIEAHEVEPSPHVARVGGPYLWVLAVEAEN